MKACASGNAGAQSRALRREVSRLARRVQRVESTIEQLTAVEPWLRARGLEVTPHRSEKPVVPRAAALRSTYYQVLRHYSFRLFLRDVIQHGNGFGLRDVVRYCGADAARRYLQILKQARLIRAAAGRGRFAVADSRVRSFGPTLEWYVAAVLRTEFGMAAEHGLRVAASAGGGDFDVLARWGDRLVYVETKASPPRNIEQSQVDAFLRRVNALRPQVAIFLNDTRLRMADKMAALFAQALGQLPRRGSRRRSPVERLHGEIFTVESRLFIANSHPDIVGNLRICLVQYLRCEGWGVSLP